MLTAEDNIVPAIEAVTNGLAAVLIVALALGASVVALRAGWSLFCRFMAWQYQARADRLSSKYD